MEGFAFLFLLILFGGLLGVCLDTNIDKNKKHKKDNTNIKKIKGGTMILFIEYTCPHCGEEQREQFNKLPFRWFCSKCGKPYSIIVVADGKDDELIVKE